MSNSAEGCNAFDMPLYIPTEPKVIKIQVEVSGWAEDILGISAQRRERPDLHRRLLKTMYLNAEHSSSDGTSFIVNGSFLACDMK